MLFRKGFEIQRRYWFGPSKQNHLIAYELLDFTRLIPKPAQLANSVFDPAQDS